MITDAANVASDALTDWRELAKDKSTVSISCEHVTSGLRTRVDCFTHLTEAIEHAT